MKITSVQRRLERYRIIYVWKILEGLAPDCGVSVQSGMERFGRKCSIPKIKKGCRKALQSIREQSFQVNGPLLFNSLPPYIRNLTKCSLDEFKMNLDQYLQLIPDEPKYRELTPGGCDPMARASNSLLHQKPPAADALMHCAGVEESNLI